MEPDLGRDRIRVVSQVPTGQRRVAGRHILLGDRLLGDDAQIAVQARRTRTSLRTEVRLDRVGTRLTIGHVLPAGSRVRGVWLDGDEVDWRIVPTARGRELVADTTDGRHTLTIRLGQRLLRK